jgi:DNA-directed RNA polymerase sigma subunit (sigma70/sigma32)
MSKFPEEEAHSLSDSVSSNVLDSPSASFLKKLNSVKRNSRSRSSAGNAIESFLFNYVVKFPLLSKEEEREIVIEKDQNSRKMLLLITAFPGLYDFVVDIRGKIIKKERSIRTVIDLSYIQNKLPEDSGDLIVEEVLRRMDQCIEKYENFFKATEKLRHSSQLDRVYELAEPVLESFLNLHLRKKIHLSYINKYYAEAKIFEKIEADFTLSRKKKKAKAPEKKQQQEEMLRRNGCSLVFFKKYLKRFFTAYRIYARLRMKLINSNLRLVFSLAKSALNMSNDMNRDMLIDVLQEGFFALVKAVDRFDIKKNCRMCTHTYVWIQHRIQRYKSDQPITTPVYTREMSCLLYKAENALADQLQRKPTIVELSEYTKIPLAKIERIRLLTKSTIRSDKQITSEGNLSVGDQILSNEFDNDFENLGSSFFKGFTNKCLINVSAKNEELIRRINQTNSFMGRALCPKDQKKNAALCHNIEVDRVRQMRTRAFNKAKNQLQKQSNPIIESVRNKFKLRAQRKSITTLQKIKMLRRLGQKANSRNENMGGNALLTENLHQPTVLAH